MVPVGIASCNSHRYSVRRNANDPLNRSVLNGDEVNDGKSWLRRLLAACHPIHLQPRPYRSSLPSYIISFRWNLYLTVKPPILVENSTSLSSSMKAAPLGNMKNAS